MANTSKATYPKNQPGKASKPANQGSAGKVFTQQPTKTGVPKGGKPGATVTMFTKLKSGIRGSK